MNRISIPDSGSAVLALDLVKVIDDNSAYLSEVDGAIGDGDHGINMRKGFDRFAVLASEKNVQDASGGLILLGATLLNEIGGSMGPLYGSFFKALGRKAKGKDIDAQVLLEMLKDGMDAVMSIGEAKPGDKTMLDALAPGIDAFEKAINGGSGFADALNSLAAAAAAGADATVGMLARVGRASRLGERSKGFRDAGATSCALLLTQMSGTMKELLGN